MTASCLRLVSLLAALLVGCLSSEPSKNAKPDASMTMTDASLAADANTGLDCEDDDDCNGGRCLPDGSGGQACVTSCFSDFGLPAGYFCENESPRACSDGSAAQRDAHCLACGCDSGETCTFGDSGTRTCKPAVAEGEPCVQHDDCASKNCSQSRGLCQAALGAACTADNCDRCHVMGDFSFCSRECASDSGCDEGAPLCIEGLEQVGKFYCYPNCNGCPDGQCGNFNVRGDESGEYCQCSGCSLP